MYYRKLIELQALESVHNCEKVSRLRGGTSRRRCRSPTRTLVFCFMLPRHLLARAQRARVASARLQRLQAPNVAPASPILLLRRNFHASSSRADELPKSPYRTFVDTLREEIRKNRELQDSVKQLQGDVEKIQDLEAMKRARDMYERARVRHLSRLFSAVIS